MTVLFAATMSNEVGTGRTLPRMFATSLTDNPVGYVVTPSSDGLRIAVNGDVQNPVTHFIEPLDPDTATSRYIISTIKISMGSTYSDTSPEFKVFGLVFPQGGFDQFGVSIQNRVLNICTVHDTTDDTGYAYVNGRFVGNITPTKRIEIFMAPGQRVAMNLLNLTIHAVAIPGLLESFEPELIPLGTDSTDWEIETSLEADLTKDNPTLTTPRVTSRIDGAEINVAATGTILIEAAGLVEESAGSHIEANGKLLALTATQNPAPITIVEASGTVKVSRVAN